MPASLYYVSLSLANKETFFNKHEKTMKVQ